MLYDAFQIVAVLGVTQSCFEASGSSAFIVVLGVTQSCTGASGSPTLAAVLRVTPSCTGASGSSAFVPFLFLVLPNRVLGLLVQKYLPLGFDVTQSRTRALVY